MNWRVWEGIERILTAHSIKPLLAVVPDNRDPELAVGPAAADFWERVRLWQRRGWVIALHGFQHRYVNNNGGLMGITFKSEFAGLSRDEQNFKLRAGMKLFCEEGVVAQAWIAPSHSFDQTTVELLSKVGIRVISDGLSKLPFVDRHGITWVPQQLWERFRPKIDGVWTVCCHHNNWDLARLEEFARQIAIYEKKIASFTDVAADCDRRGPGLGDRAYAWIWRARAFWGQRLSLVRRPFRLAAQSKSI
jgi:hypothetical protein